jgi:hypothetical protein
VNKISSHEDTKPQRIALRIAVAAALMFATYILYWNAFNQGVDTALCAVDVNSTNDIKATLAKPYCQRAKAGWAGALGLKNPSDIPLLCAFVASCELSK